MKIAIYSHSIPPEVDGVSRRFTYVVDELLKAGHEVLLFTLEKTPSLDIPPSARSRFRYVTLDSAVPYLYLGKVMSTPTVNNLVVIWRTIMRERPDVVHATMDVITLMFGLAGRMAGVPVVGSVHTDLQTGLKAVGAGGFTRFMVNWKEQMESKLLNSLATTSPSFRAKLEAQGIACRRVIQTGVRSDLFTPEARCAETRNRLTFGNPEGLLVVYVGRLAPEKNLDKLVEMCGSVKGVYLALIGDGPVAQRMGAKHGPNKNQGGLYCQAGFLGHEELPSIYASCDAHISYSLFETLGNTVLEAHACGIPVVAPRAQGFIDTVQDKVDGYIFDPARPLEGGDFLARLRDDRKLCETMGKNGRIKVLQHAPSVVVADMVDWYGDSVTQCKEERLLSRACKTVLLVGMTTVLVVVVGVYNTIMPLAPVKALVGAWERAKDMPGHSPSSIWGQALGACKVLAGGNFNQPGSETDQ